MNFLSHKIKAEESMSPGKTKFEFQQMTLQLPFASRELTATISN